MTQSNDLPSRMNRAEDNIIDLRLAAGALLQATEKNSADIAALIEVTRRNNEGIVNLREGMIALQLSQLRTEAALQVFQQHTDEAIAHLTTSEQRTNAVMERLTASEERMEQLMESWIRRDQ